MQNTILLHGTTPKELAEILTESIKSQLSTLEKSLDKPNSEELFTRKEACKFLKIDSSTLWHWTNKGKVTAYGVGHRRYYKKTELLECLIPLNK